MQTNLTPTNGEHISPTSESPTSPLKEQPRLENGSAAAQLGSEALQQESSKSPSTISKTVSKSRWANYPKIQRAVNWFEKVFGENISVEHQQKAQEIQGHISAIKDAVNRAGEISVQETKKESSFADDYPSEKTIAAHKQSLEEMQAQLSTAEKELKGLESLEGNVRDLKQYSKYKDLPLYITGARASVKYLRGRVQVAEKLVKIEEKMEAYNHTKEWKDFKQIREARRELATQLREVLQDSSNPEIQKHLRNPQLTAHDSYVLVKRTYPSLRGYIERLLDFTVEINNERIENLHQQQKDLKSAVATYHKQAEKVATLERYLYDKSIGSLFGAFIHSLLAKKELPTELEEAKAQLRRDYLAMKAKKDFNREEIQWLTEMATLNSDHIELIHKIGAAEQSFNQARLEEHISHQLTKLERRVGVKSIQKRVLELDKLVSKSIKNNPNISSSQLPEGFAEMDSIAQMRVLIPIAYPNLKFKMRHAFAESIDKLKEKERKKVDKALSIAHQVAAVPDYEKFEQQLAEGKKVEQRVETSFQSASAEYNEIMKQLLEGEQKEEQIVSRPEQNLTEQATNPSLKTAPKQGIVVEKKIMEQPVTPFTEEDARKYGLKPLPPTTVPPSSLQPYTEELSLLPNSDLEQKRETPLESSTVTTTSQEAVTENKEDEASQTDTSNKAPPAPIPPLMPQLKAPPPSKPPAKKEDIYAKNIADGQQKPITSITDVKLRKASDKKQSEAERILDEIKQGKLNSQSKIVQEGIKAGTLEQSEVNKAEAFYRKGHPASDLTTTLTRALDTRRNQVKEKRDEEEEDDEEEDWAP